MATDMYGDNMDQMDKSLLSGEIRMAGSCCAKVISDFEARFAGSVLLKAEDPSITCGEIFRILKLNSNFLQGLQKTRLDLYSYKLWKAATVFTARGRPESNLLGFSAMYLNHVSKEAYISICTVNEVYRSQGIGTALFTIMEQYANEKGMNRIRFVTSYDNDKAQRLYERLGYSATKSLMNAGRMGVLYEKDFAIRRRISSGDSHSESQGDGALYDPM